MEIIGASILASVITTKILATYYFKKRPTKQNVKSYLITYKLSNKIFGMMNLTPLKYKICSR